jgi:hypothetical protein
MFDFIIKALGGYTKEEYDSKEQFIENQSKLNKVVKNIDAKTVDKKDFEDRIAALKDKIDDFNDGLTDIVNNLSDNLSGDVTEIWEYTKQCTENDLDLKDKLIQINSKIDEMKGVSISVLRILPDSRFEKCYDSAREILEMDEKQQKARIDFLENRKTYKDCIILKIVKEEKQRKNEEQ